MQRIPPPHPDFLRQLNLGRTTPSVTAPNRQATPAFPPVIRQTPRPTPLSGPGIPIPMANITPMPTHPMYPPAPNRSVTPRRILSIAPTPIFGGPSRPAAAVSLAGAAVGPVRVGCPGAPRKRFKYGPPQRRRALPRPHGFPPGFPPGMGMEMPIDADLEMDSDDLLPPPAAAAAAPPPILRDEDDRDCRANLLGKFNESYAKNSNARKGPMPPPPPRQRARTTTTTTQNRRTIRGQRRRPLPPPPRGPSMGMMSMMLRPPPLAPPPPSSRSRVKKGKRDDDGSFLDHHHHLECFSSSYSDGGENPSVASAASTAEDAFAAHRSSRRHGLRHRIGQGDGHDGDGGGGHRRRQTAVDLGRFFGRECEVGGKRSRDVFRAQQQQHLQRQMQFQQQQQQQQQVVDLGMRSPLRKRRKML